MHPSSAPRHVGDAEGSRLTVVVVISDSLKVLHGPVPGKYSVAVSRGPRARAIPSHRVVTGPVWTSEYDSGRMLVRQAPVLVGVYNVTVVVLVGPRRESPIDRSSYCIHCAAQITSDAPGPVVGP